MKYIVNHINNIQNFQPIFRDTPCCLGSYTCTVVLEAGNRVWVLILSLPFKKSIIHVLLKTFCILNRSVCWLNNSNGQAIIAIQVYTYRYLVLLPRSHLSSYSLITVFIGRRDTLVWRCPKLRFMVSEIQDNSQLFLLTLERGRPFDSEGGGGGGWHFLEINILTLKMLEINNLSSSGKKINNLTLTC